MAAHLPPGCRNLSGNTPPGKARLSSSRLSLTHTASPKGWDIPAFRQHLTICCTIFCSSHAHWCWPSIFQNRVRPTAWPHTVTNLGWPEPQQALNPAFHCTPIYLLLIFSFFQNFSWGYFSTKSVPALGAEWNEKFHWELRDVAQNVYRSVSPLNNHQFCSSFTSSFHSALQTWSMWLWLSLLHRIGECGKLSCLKNQICSPSGNLFTSLCKWYSSNSVFLCFLNWTGWEVWLVTRCHEVWHWALQTG